MIRCMFLELAQGQRKCDYNRQYQQHGCIQTGQRRLSSGARQEDRGAKSLVSRLAVASGWVLIGVHEQKKLDLWEKHTWHVRC